GRTRRNRLTKALSELQGALCRRLRKQNHDLLATVASAQVDRANGVGQHLRNVLERGVAPFVTIAIIDLFEMIEVEQNQRASSTESVRLSGDATELFIEVASVRETGQHIGARALAHLLDFP